VISYAWLANHGEVEAWAISGSSKVLSRMMQRFIDANRFMNSNFYTCITESIMVSARDENG
jgi:hypothetical protein